MFDPLSSHLVRHLERVVPRGRYKLVMVLLFTMDACNNGILFLLKKFTGLGAREMDW